MTNRTDDDDAFDERGILKNGRVARRRLDLHDAIDVNDAVQLYDTHRRALCADAISAAGHRAGWGEDKTRGRAAGYPVNEALEQAYADAASADANAWHDREHYWAGKEGQTCTVDNGLPGHVKNGVCVADETGIAEVDAALAAADAIADAKESAYQRAEILDANAWRVR